MRVWIALVTFLLASCGAEKPAEDKAKAPVKPPEVFRVKFVTTKGDIVVEARREWAPRGADRFYELVQEKFFDDSRFYRVIRKYVAQFGIHREPKMNALWGQLKFPDDPVKQKNDRGTLSFAHDGPATRTTQIFINLAGNNILDKQGFAPFAKVVGGMDVVDQLTFVYGDLAPRGAGPDPKRLERESNSYLDRAFPRLDAIKTARLLE